MEQQLKVEKDKVDKITKIKSSEIDRLKIELEEQKKKAEYLKKESTAWESYYRNETLEKENVKSAADAKGQQLENEARNKDIKILEL